MMAYPQYSQNLPRLVGLVASKYPRPGLIDVGANIGDTVRFVRAVDDTPVLCIEGNEDYTPFCAGTSRGCLMSGSRSASWERATRMKACALCRWRARDV